MGNTPPTRSLPLASSPTRGEEKLSAACQRTSPLTGEVGAKRRVGVETPWASIGLVQHLARGGDTGYTHGQ